MLVLLMLLHMQLLVPALLLRVEELELFGLEDLEGAGRESD